MSKYTPGPWNCRRASAAGREIIVSEISPVDVAVLSHRNKSQIEIDANARLIAAAPEMLDALIEILGWQTNLPFNVIAQARAAIAKATGEK